MRASDIREQTQEELETRLDETKKNLFNLKFQKAIGQLENTQALRNLRKEIALIETLIREKELGINKDLNGNTVKKARSSSRKRVAGKRPAAKDKKTKKNSTKK